MSEEEKKKRLLESYQDFLSRMDELDKDKMEMVKQVIRRIEEKQLAEVRGKI
jgi:hypothetical protein